MNSSRSLLLFFSFIILLFSRSKSDDINSDQAALLSLRSALTPLTARWNSSASACSWTGIVCSSNRVIEIHLPASGLRGRIPVGTIGNLTALRFLSLRFNQLSGDLPSDLGSCTQLRNLNVESNSLSGEIPHAIFGLSHLTRLNLANNNFSGPFSPEFNNLTRLKTLYLESNQLSGPIPDLKATNMDFFNVSHNQLNGSVPASLQKFPPSSFLGMPLCGSPLGPCAGEPSPAPAPSPATSGVSPTVPTTTNSSEPNNSKSSKLSGGAIAGIAIGSVFGVLILLFLLVCLCRNRMKNQQNTTTQAQKRQTELPTIPQPVPAPVPTGSKKNLIFLGSNTSRLYDLEDLLRASAEVLGKGTFGTTYKAVLETGPVVAVKRLKDANLPEREFRGKMTEIGAMENENLVPVQAYYYSKDEKLVVSEFVSSGSLSSLLHGYKGSGRAPLNFETRTMIALSAARGIDYIHSTGPRASHGNIKSSNILLSRSTQARISDQGLAQLITSPTLSNRGSGYRAPEITDVRKVSQKADVYSFGVLLLELVTGKAPAHTVVNDEGVDLPKWVQSVEREEWATEVFDRELVREENKEQEMVQFLQLAMDCTVMQPDRRPSMSHVVGRIEEIRVSLGRLRNNNQEGGL
ncbi:hypothetical protein LUZ60_003152 [Juncus effusus]|nr:hypothetical protein LUZ60_003152 [Juncus effusus]